MRKRHPNHRIIKGRRTYTVDEIARLFGLHKNTVHQWIKTGLPVIDDKRPILVLGEELISFLQARRAGKKQPCLPGQMYCVRCRAPRFPAGCMVDCRPLTEKIGNLSAICSACDSIMHRCVSMATLNVVRGEMDISFTQALSHIAEITQPTVNSDLRRRREL